MAVLCYHSVRDDWESPLAVRPDDFERHCAWLARRHSVLPAVELLDAQASGKRGARSGVALTFDDGFADFIDGAVPSLVRQRLPSTMFLVARTLEEGRGGADWLDPQEAQAPATLTESQVLELADQGVEMGSHSWAHHDLRTLSEAECTIDLRESKERLEDLLHREVPLLAYPYGFHAEHVRRAAAAAGYRYALSLPEGPETTGDQAVPRAGLYRGDGVTALRIKSSRWFVPARMATSYPPPGRLGDLLRKVTSR